MWMTPNYGMAGGVPMTTTSRVSSRASEPPARSFVLHDHAHGTRESAIAAGIPVVDSPPRASSNNVKRGTPERVINQNHVNREGSDDELRKIRADHHDKENASTAPESFYLNQRVDSSIDRPDSLNVLAGNNRTGSNHDNKSVGEGDAPSPVTSFAQIKKQKDNGEIPQSMFYLHSTPSPQKNSDLKGAFQQRKGKK